MMRRYDSGALLRAARHVRGAVAVLAVASAAVGAVLGAAGAPLVLAAATPLLPPALAPPSPTAVRWAAVGGAVFGAAVLGPLGYWLAGVLRLLAAMGEALAAIEINTHLAAVRLARWCGGEAPRADGRGDGADGAERSVAGRAASRPEGPPIA